jgi:hypothetical protein
VTYNGDRRRNLSTDYVLRGPILGAFVDLRSAAAHVRQHCVREPAPLR